MFPIGLAVSNVAMQSGKCSVRLRFSAPFGDGQQSGGIVLGYRSPEQHYIFAQLGAAHSAYSIGEYVSGFGWRPLVTVGELQNLKIDHDYMLRLDLLGQELKMFVDDVPLIQHLLATPLEGRQVGLIATGNNRVSFSNAEFSGAKPKAFVVMQVAEPYDTFYREVIQNQAEAAGFEVFRMDEKAGPGVIFQDIQREIEQSEIVIAEITPPNPNVFYPRGSPKSGHTGSPENRPMRNRVRTLADGGILRRCEQRLERAKEARSPRAGTAGMVAPAH
jgi:hypothetical protein